MNRILPYLLTCLLFWNVLPAQSWTFYQPPIPSGTTPNWGNFTSIHEVPDSGYILSGYITPGAWSPLLTRIDDDANLIWSDFDPNGQVNGINGYITDLQPTPDGGFIGFSNTIGDGIRARKIDANGNDIWSYSFAATGNANPFAWDKRSYYLNQNVAGDILGILSNPGPPTLVKLTAAGTVTFNNTYTGMPSLGDRVQCRFAPGGGAFISGIDQYEPFLSRINPDGSVRWSRSYSSTPGQTGNIIATQVGTDTTLTILWSSNQYFTSQFNLNLVKYSPDGDTLWNYQTPQQSSYPHNFADMFQDSLGILILYNTDSTGPSKVVEMSHQGVVLDSFLVDPFPVDPWMTGYIETRYGRIIRDSKGRILLAGSVYNFSNSHPIAIRLDSLNQFDINSVSGTIFMDDNQDCVPQSTETRLSQWLVLSGNIPLAFSDSSGSYSQGLSTNGPHKITTIPPANQWANLWDITCPPMDTHFVTVVSGQDDNFTGLDFGAEPLIACPMMWVDISAPLIRACRNNNYYVNYCNLGTSPADSVYILVSLDSSLTFVSSPQPYTIVSGTDSIRFDLGTVPPGQCGSFRLIANVVCDTANPGRIHCATAHIYPDSNCAPIDPNWSGASLEVNAECLLNDSVRFTIANTGTANMVNASGVWVVEDDILRFSNAVQLNIGEDSVFTIKGNGSTWAALVDQVPFHPGPSLPRAIYEGCGTNLNGGINVGFAGQFADDDMPPNISIDCQPDITAYDPNDKVPFPTGTGSNNEIFASDELEYMIRFQNTGNDTAFKVVIRDHIPSTLDLTTFIMAGSSHPFTLNILSGNVLEWTFAPIALPDSGTNFVESQGFLKFNIRQQPGNTPGTLIENAAEIYFDFNAPVITDTAWHTIAAPYQMQILTHLDDPQNPLHILAYPNPFSESITFRLSDANKQDLRIELFDLNGKLVQLRELRDVNQFKVDRGGLPDGIYLYRITGSAGANSQGKLMIQTD